MPVQHFIQNITALFRAAPLPTLSYPYNEREKIYKKTVVIKLIFRKHLQYHIFAFTLSDRECRETHCVR